MNPIADVGTGLFFLTAKAAYVCCVFLHVLWLLIVLANPILCCIQPITGSPAERAVLDSSDIPCHTTKSEIMCLSHRSIQAAPTGESMLGSFVRATYCWALLLLPIKCGERVS